MVIVAAPEIIFYIIGANFVLSELLDLLSRAEMNSLQVMCCISAITIRLAS